MNIFSVSTTQGAASVGGVKGVEATAATGRTAAEGLSSVNDGVSLSVDAVQAASSASDIRLDRVNAIKAAIADGSYETPEKLDIALDRLLDRLS
jgi:negative regulator of flagellin synthesis FlgM